MSNVATCSWSSVDHQMRGEQPPGGAGVDEAVQVVQHDQVAVRFGRARTYLVQVGRFARHVSPFMFAVILSLTNVLASLIIPAT